jgi:hypothetical protein
MRALGVLWCETAPKITEHRPSENGRVAINVGIKGFPPATLMKDVTIKTSLKRRQQLKAQNC